MAAHDGRDVHLSAHPAAQTPIDSGVCESFRTQCLVTHAAMSWSAPPLSTAQARPCDTSDEGAPCCAAQQLARWARATERLGQRFRFRWAV